MIKTPVYELNQPQGNDSVDIELLNENARKIDNILNLKIDYSKKSDSISSVSSETIATSKAVKSAYDKGVEALGVANRNETQLADYTKLIPYAVATGTANIYAIASPTIDSLVVGMAISVKIDIDSTGTSTLNWDGKGAKTIKKANGTNVTNLKAGGVYTLRYDGTNFILQGEGGSGDAIASELLSGKKASTDAGDIVGTMKPHTGALNRITLALLTDGASTAGHLYVKPETGHFDGIDGWVDVADVNFLSGNIKAGVSMFGKMGTFNKTLGSGDKLTYSQMGFTKPLIKVAASQSDYNNASLRGVTGANGITVKFYNDYVRGYNDDGVQLWNTHVGWTTGGIWLADVCGDFVYVATEQNGYTVGVAKIRISTGARIWFVSYPSGGYSQVILGISVSPADGYLYVVRDRYDGSSWNYELLIVNTATGATVSTNKPTIINDGNATYRYKKIIAIDETYFMIVNPYKGAGDMSLFSITAPTTPIWTAQVGSIASTPKNIINVGTSWFMMWGTKLWRSVDNGIMTNLGVIGDTTNNNSIIARTNDNKLLIPTNTVGTNKVYDTNGVVSGTIVLYSAAAQIIAIGRSGTDDTMFLEVQDTAANIRYSLVLLIMSMTIQ